MLLLITGDLCQSAALEAALKADPRTCELRTANIHCAASSDPEWSEHYRHTVVMGAEGSAYMVGEKQYLGEIRYDPAQPVTAVEEIVRLLARSGHVVAPVLRRPTASHRRPMLPHGGEIGGPSGA